jgi:phosphatidylinositol-bisphosphatase
LDEDAGQDREKVAAAAVKYAARNDWLARWDGGDFTARPLQDLRKTNVLQVLCVQWNLHGKAYPEAVSRLLAKQHLGDSARHHLYVVGTAECERSIAKSEIAPKKKKWEAALDAVLGEECALIASASLCAMHLAIYARKEIAGELSDVKVKAVATGWGGLIGNKGGIRVSFTFGSTSFLFVNTHLPSGQKKAEKRDKAAKKVLPPADACDYAFVLGDLNYRVDLSREEAEKMIALGDGNALLAKDQLAPRLGAAPWEAYAEGAIEFAPTYKLDAGTDRYDTSKKRRVPSWTDRILYKDHPSVKLVAYNSLKDVRLSDHRPVFAQFDVGVRDTTQSAVGLEIPKPRRVTSRGCSVM